MIGSHDTLKATKRYLLFEFLKNDNFNTQTFFIPKAGYTLEEFKADFKHDLHP